MKLINKFTLWYLCIALTCTVVGTAITYYSIKNRIDSAALDRLKTINQLAAEAIKTGTLKDSVVQGRKIEVHELSTALPAKPYSVTEVPSVDPATKKPESILTISSYYSINGKNYSITCYGYVSKANQILSGLEISVLWKWALIIFLIAISARLVSRLVLSPFNATVKAIGHFNLKQKEKLQLPTTNTKEFMELNSFVKAMTDKAIDDYISLKEFTENASHELQTPVAVMRNKLELLGESDLTDEQALMIADIQNSLEKLSRINSSLVLLTRLENHEYETKEPLHFCKLINSSLASYKELIDMKSLSLSKNVAKSVYVQLHPMLGDLLLNNLISNAIRHNIPNGNIDVQLTHTSLVIKNNGMQPSVPTEELFQRFKKSDQCSKSIGIGLAIVKQICDIHHFAIQYHYSKGLHVIEIQFKAVGPPAQPAVAAVEEPAATFAMQPA
jgi:signal transduction histidine kinase